jgi:hypothetical protein
VCRHIELKRPIYPLPNFMKIHYTVLELLRVIANGQPSETDIATLMSSSFDKCNNCQISALYMRVVRKIRFPRSCSREERCYAGSGDTGV